MCIDLLRACGIFAYMVYDRSMNDCVSSSTDCISACGIVSKSNIPSLMGVFGITISYWYWQAHRVQAFAKIKAVQHDKQASTEKHTMACTRKSPRLDRATWGGTPSCDVVSKGASLVTHSGSTVPATVLKSCSSWSWVLLHAGRTRP